MKKWLPVFLAGLLLACTCSVPSRILPEPTTTKPVVPLDPTRSEAENTFTVVKFHPEDGDLTELLHGEAPKAAALGQHMFVEFDASW